MSWRRYKLLLILGGFLVFTIASVYVISLYWPRYEEYFFELGLLGKDRLAEDYFPNENSTVNIGTPISWHVYVHNHMGQDQDVVVRVKILNSTMEAQDDRGHEPSPQPYFLEIPISLSIDETAVIPFSWMINDAYSLTVNIDLFASPLANEVVYVNLESIDDRFRIVFELWVYDEVSDEYVFGWYSKGEYNSASIYIWLNLNF